jgi:hypothetical protein
MGWILCHLGRHSWRQERNPEAGGGRDGTFSLCRRCGKEKAEYGRPPATGVGAG